MYLILAEGAGDVALFGLGRGEEEVMRTLSLGVQMLVHINKI